MVFVIRDICEIRNDIAHCSIELSCTVAVLIDAGYVVGSDAGRDADVECGGGVSEGPLS